MKRAFCLSRPFWCAERAKLNRKSSTYWTILFPRPFFPEWTSKPRRTVNCTLSFPDQVCFTVTSLFQEMDYWWGTRGRKTPRKDHSFKFSEKKTSNNTQWIMKYSSRIDEKITRRSQGGICINGGIQSHIQRHAKNLISQWPEIILKITISWHNLKRSLVQRKNMNQSWKTGEENAAPRLVYIVVEATVTISPREHFLLLLPALRDEKKPSVFFLAPWNKNRKKQSYDGLLLYRSKAFILPTTQLCQRAKIFGCARLISSKTFATWHVRYQQRRNVFQPNQL